MGEDKTQDEGKIAVDLLGSLLSAKTECPDDEQVKRKSLPARKGLPGE